ncbi:helix-turn-helix domain-containing protein [Paenibacillus tundrae]|uniref:Transcriptional regulator with XRE-family HTH domain n=1 Tax=Paenibacillus tundrae TaxID=528187 RepID=A0ABT9W7B7_9BACL|nr:helix-turn-helix transcriptional regulator [Paenibacillus tundrae]MDQ0169146.1 transcriptional regulator with XRE-family HTH domain [Paenibacillus tundrae]
MSQPIGKIIKSLRNKHKLSQDELAEKLNQKFNTTINKGMISKWENDLGDPRLDTVRHLSVFFNVSLDYLLGRTDEPNDTTSDEGDAPLDKNYRKIERFARKVSPDVLEKAVKILDAAFEDAFNEEDYEDDDDI